MLWWVACGLVVVLGVVGVLTPRLSRPTVPLGVDVPSGYVDHPVVKSAVARFQVSMLAVTIGWLMLVGMAYLLGGGSARVAGAVVLYVTVGVVTSMVVLWRVTSSPIREAKRVQGWYDGARVAVIASVTGTPDPAARVRWGWHIATLAALAALVVYAVVQYSSFADPLPTHGGAAGADQWAAKSWLVVLAPVLVALGLAVGITLISIVVQRQLPRIRPAGDPVGAADDSSRRSGLTQHLVGVANLLMVLIVGVQALVTWHGGEVASLSALTLLIPVVVVGGSVAVIARSPARRSTVPNRHSGPESPDEDDKWILGAFYCSREDPRLLVSKRAGVGGTLNFGHPAGKVILVVVAVLLIYALAIPLIA